MIIWTHTSRTREPGKRGGVDVGQITPADIRADDIVESLAYQNRYIGHVGTYSVAQHSVLVCNEVMRLLNVAPGANRMVLGWALLHDASEAYVGDWPRPLKHADTAAAVAFRRLERNVQMAIAEAFGLPVVIPSVVEHADRAVLAAEARDLFRATRSEMDGEWGLAGIDAAPMKVSPWRPLEARSVMRGIMCSLQLNDGGNNGS